MQRYLFIDYTKFIGISLVVFGHILQNFSLTDNNYYCLKLWEFIYLFHVPLFFIVSGFLYKNKEHSANIDKIIFGLLIPYLIYQFVYLPFICSSYIINYHYPMVSTFFKCLAGILLGDFLTSDYSLPVCGPCWFIISIITIRFLCNFINLTVKNILLVVIFAVSILKFLVIKNIDLYFCIDNTLLAIPYFFLGYFIKQKLFQKNFISENIFKISDFNKHLFNIVYLLISIIILLVILKYNGLIQMNLRINTILQRQSLILSYIAGVTGSLLIFKISALLKWNLKFIEVISKNTLFIIFYHYLIIFIFSWCKYKSLIYLFNSTFSKICFCIFSAFLILLISYFSIIIFEKNMPIILGKRKKLE